MVPQMSLANKLSKAVGAAALSFAVAGPMVVNADGATSISSVYRARIGYGNRILALEEAAKAGNFEAFDSKQPVLFLPILYCTWLIFFKPVDKKAVAIFDLFIAGTNSRPGEVSKERKATESRIESELFAAVKAKDAGKLRAAFEEFKKVADLNSEFKEGELGQTDSSGYSPTWGTSKQYIYQR